MGDLSLKAGVGTDFSNLVGGEFARDAASGNFSFQGASLSESVPRLGHPRRRLLYRCRLIYIYSIGGVVSIIVLSNHYKTTLMIV